MVPNHSARTGRLGRATQLVIGAALLTATLSGCSTEEALRFGWPEGITPQAEQMRNLWTGSVVAALVVGVFVWGLMFWCVIRYRKRANVDELPVQTRFNLPIEVLYTVVPFLIIAVLFYYTAVVQTYVDKQSDRADVAIGVVANKWNWQFSYVRETYKDADGDNQVVQTTGSSEEVPILVLPVGQSIRFEENSKDVIHSFWVPDLLFKRDVIPGRTNSFEISSIDREGSYVGRCAELCGTYHSQMNFEVRVVNATDFRKYIEGRTKGLTQAEALTDIGQAPAATTTHPFNTDRTARQSS